VKRPRGFSLIEMIVAIALALVVGLIVAGLLSHLLATAQIEPERTDRDQRLRVLADALAERLRAGGAGLTRGEVGTSSGALVPVVFPHRRGTVPADPELSAFDDRFTVLTALAGGPQALVLSAMPSSSAPVPVPSQPGCQPQPACGFVANTRAMVFDRTGHFDLFRVSGILPAAVAHDPAELSRAYGPAGGAQVRAVDLRAFWWDAASDTLRQLTGGGGSQPMADHVVGFRVRYFGDPAPPLAPRPPAGVASCLFDAAGQPLLAALAPTEGSWVELTPPMLQDGPICGAPPHRFDADLYRVRFVRVTVRVEAALDSARGADPAIFRRPGFARSVGTSVPDLEVSFDVALRNVP
jgi:prepilin-type N-terminal cleavage/methylation domain-containing protein